MPDAVRCPLVPVRIVVVRALIGPLIASWRVGQVMLRRRVQVHGDSRPPESWLAQLLNQFPDLRQGPNSNRVHEE